MSDMGEVFNKMRAADKERRHRNLKNADLTGFTEHSYVHYSRQLLGDRLDYWPSRNKWRWRGKNYHGDVHKFIANREAQP